VELYTELFYAIVPTYLVAMLFADQLSLHLVTFLMLFILVYNIYTYRYTYIIHINAT